MEACPILSSKCSITGDILSETKKLPRKGTMQQVPTNI